MGEIKKPRYVQDRKLADGTTGYYWCRPSWAKDQVRAGRKFSISSQLVGTNKDIAKMFDEAEKMNDLFDSWKKGETTGPTPGSVNWLFAWYRSHSRFGQLKDKTRADYLRAMDLMANQKMRQGVLGEKKAAKVNATVADTMFERIKKNNGLRTATATMQVCSTIWNIGIRHADKTFLEINPFAKMNLPSKTGDGNRETSREEYDLYRETAREMGLQSMATAAALSFGFGQRVSDVFGFKDQKDRDVPAISWAHYKPGETFTFIQNKRGKKVIIPLTATIEGETVKLYPDVEEELARTPKTAMVIVVEERTGLPYSKRHVAEVHRRICDKAGLPKEMTFTGFRHGALTEIGDSGVEDARAIAGHSDIATTRIYDKITARKAQTIGVMRLNHVKEIGDTK